MTKTYIAIYEKDATDEAWNVRVDSVPGCRAQERTIVLARARIRQELGWRVGFDSASVLVEDRLPPPTIAAVAKRATRARREAARAVARARQEVTSAARDLAGLGLSRRDCAALLGLSHQRIQQLVASG
jgi:predicted RNase H-like HicB family nuclease